MIALVQDHFLVMVGAWLSEMDLLRFAATLERGMPSPKGHTCESPASRKRALLSPWRPHPLNVLQ